MRRFVLLLMSSVLVAATAEPALAQSVETSPVEKKAAKAELKQLSEKYKTAEKLFGVADKVLGMAAKDDTKGIRVQPQLSLGNLFWRNAKIAKSVGLSEEQQRKMEDVFQEHRLRLIDLNGNLVKEEAVLTALMEDLRADEESKVLLQIDRVAQARAELEKANARMLLGLRHVLTAEQWNRLSAITLPADARRF